jgi:hypothetical protein
MEVEPGMTASNGPRTTTGPQRRARGRPPADDPTVTSHAADQTVVPGPSAEADEHQPPPTIPASSPPDTGESPLKAAISVLTTLGPPLTIVTALMIYFGWARSAKQAQYMGLDVSLFGFSTQDYVLLSTSTLYIPLLAIAALTLGWLVLHHRLSRALNRSASQRARLRMAGRAALAAGLLAAAGAVVTATLDQDRAPLVLPLALAAGTAAAAYGAWLTRAANDHRATEPGPLPWQHALRTLLIGGLITLALFWELSNYAGVVGRGYALKIAASIPSLPRATAYSATPLGIQAPGVLEETLNVGPGPGKATMRYQTTGLRFLIRSGGRIFLLHDGWTPQHGTVIVLPDNDQVHWQFSR